MSGGPVGCPGNAWANVGASHGGDSARAKHQRSPYSATSELFCRRAGENFEGRQWTGDDTCSSQLKSGLTLLKLRGLLPFRFGLGGAAGPRQGSGKPSVSFDIGRVARHRFLVALDSVRDLILLK